MKVQSVSNNNYYNSTFCAGSKFDKQKYIELKLLRRAMISDLMLKEFDSNKYINLVLKFKTKFIESPQERRGLRPMESYFKEYMSNPEIGLRQMFYMWRNGRKLEKEIHSMTIVQKIKTSKNNIEQSECEKGVKALKKFFGISDSM